MDRRGHDERRQDLDGSVIEIVPESRKAFSTKAGMVAIDLDKVIAISDSEKDESAEITFENGARVNVQMNPDQARILVTAFLGMKQSWELPPDPDRRHL